MKSLFSSRIPVVHRWPRYILWGVILALLGLSPERVCLGAQKADREQWQVHPRFETLKPRVVAVLPMDNVSLEPDLETHLKNEVYKRLTAKGYSKIKKDRVAEVMQALGIKFAGQLAGISLQKLGQRIPCDAILTGQIDQSASIHSGVYDAIVVSCSLRLVDCKSGEVLWQTEQWRTAHRQWQLDPINMLLNFMAHENASREERVAYLVQEMLHTLPQGHIRVEYGDLLNKAQIIPVQE